MMPDRLVPRTGLGWLVVSLGLLAGAAFAILPPWGALAPSQTATAQSQIPQDELERRVRAYLLENPEVVAEALKRLQERERAAELKAGRAVLKARADEVFHDPETPVGGNPEGDVTLVEFFDYNCRYCRRAAPVMRKVEASDSKLRIVYKEFPILGKSSKFAAKAALAAHRQGKYVPLHKALMATEGKLSEEAVLETADRVGLDIERLKKDMADPAIQAHIDRNLELARALKITGTPGFVVGDQIVPGVVELAALQRLIGAAREKK